MYVKILMKIEKTYKHEHISKLFIVICPICTVIKQSVNILGGIWNNKSRQGNLENSDNANRHERKKHIKKETCKERMTKESNIALYENKQLITTKKKKTA